MEFHKKEGFLIQIRAGAYRPDNSGPARPGSDKE